MSGGRALISWKLPLAVLAAAALVTAAVPPAPEGGFEASLARAAAEEAAASSADCPLSRAAIERSPDWLLAACADGGTDWIRAAELYGEDAASVYRVFGADPAFAAAFRTYGHPVVPVVAYFVRNGSTAWQVSRAVGEGLSRLWNGDGLEGVGELSPEDYGLIAVEAIADRGHEFLAEFEIVDGVAVRKPVTRVLLGAKDVFLGGVTDLEAVLARGERLPTWGEVGMAALDATVVVAGAGAAAGALRAAARPVAVAGRQGTAVARLGAAGTGAVRALAGVGRLAGVGAAVAVPYLAVTRPQLVSEAAGWVAEQAGLPAWAGAFAVWTAILGLVAALLSPLVRLIALAGRILAAPAALVARLLAARRARAA